MCCYARRVAFLASSNLKSQSQALVSSIYPRISVLGCLGIPAGLLLLSFATAAWISVFFLLPPLLICVWMALQPYRLWLFLKSRMIGNLFSG
jgi:hypothetical protein